MGRASAQVGHDFWGLRLGSGRSGVWAGRTHKRPPTAWRGPLVSRHGAALQRVHALCGLWRRLTGMRLRRAVVIIPGIKGVICGAIGGVALAYAFTATGPQSGFLPLAMFRYAIPAYFPAIRYLMAAFLLAKAQVGWRVFGALLDAAASLVISWALVEEGIALSGRDGPLPISIAIAAIWIGALVPVFVGAFRTNPLDG